MSALDAYGPITITCTRASAGNATTVPLPLNEISFNFVPTTTGIISNTAIINSGATDTNSANDNSTVSNTVLNDLQVVKTVNQSGLLGIGSTYRYTLTPSLVMGDSGGVITLEDFVPTGVSFTSIRGATFNAGPNNYTINGWTCSVTNPPTNNLESVAAVGNNTNKITCTQPTTTHNGFGGNLPLGVIQPNFIVTGAAGTTVTNTATIDSPATETDDTNNSSTIIRTIASASSANLTIDKVASVTTRSVGASFTYTLTVRNQGPADKPNGQVVTVEDIVPDGITLTSLNIATDWTCTVTDADNDFPVSGGQDAPMIDNKVSCTRTSVLNNGNTYPIIRFNAIGTVGGTITNTGKVSAVFGSHSESADVTFSSAFDLRLSKSDNNPNIDDTSYGPDPSNSQFDFYGIK